MAFLARRNLRIIGYTAFSPKLLVRNNSSSASNNYNFETLKVEQPREWVFNVQLNRPERMNAMNDTLWREVGQCFRALGQDSNCRAIVLSGNGKTFSSGLDLSEVASLFEKINGEGDVARKAHVLRNYITDFQNSFSALEECPKPVIGAIQGACVGGGVDLITACDIRYCSRDAWFQIKEVDVGLAADVGTLQRLPKIIGSDSVIRDLAFTARKCLSEEAEKIGLVSKVFPDQASLLTAALDLASVISSKSPVAVQGSKINLNYSRNHSVKDSLNYIATWNMSMLQSEDLMEAGAAVISKSKEPPTFSKL